ncbi:hypothetical protein RHGRI_033117 [Rhododendron griersonianum]|uniref:Uncharacterized protein n=1 Tax=Rhododendron griersonianum TaxID=479676 RepID=A0AAV6HYM4_9ERIC|nr:hypothetical protein RHGRI_033117 [Rhododendron griersonianum]
MSALHRSLVEMDSPELAKELVQAMSNQSFMVFGLPRPVRVCAAEKEMFEDRPQKSGTKITCHVQLVYDASFFKVQVVVFTFYFYFPRSINWKSKRSLQSNRQRPLRQILRSMLIEQVLKDGTAKSKALGPSARSFQGLPHGSGDQTTVTSCTRFAPSTGTIKESKMTLFWGHCLSRDHCCKVVDLPACIPKIASSKSAIAERGRESVSVLENGSTSEAFFLDMNPKLENLIDEILNTRNAPSQWSFHVMA